MTTLHLVLGITVLALFTAAGVWGAWCWWRVEPSPAFWGLLRAAQAVLVVQITVGALLLIMGERASGDLHLLYGLLPLAVQFVGEQLRVASADSVLEARGHPSAQAVGDLPEEQQRSVVLAIVRREMGVMALAALFTAGLVARAAFVSSAV